MTSEERHEARYRRRKAGRQRRRDARSEACGSFEQVFSYEHLYRAGRECCKGVGWKCSTQRYLGNFTANIARTHRELMDGTWKTKGFFAFDLMERGKLRHIRSVHIAERVVQRCLCDNALVPLFSAAFVYDNAASLKALYPDDELWLLMGADMFLSFQTWHEPEKVASMAGIAAFGRTEEDMEPLFSVQRDRLYHEYPDIRIFTLTVPGVIDISSTELRERLAEGTGENLLPPAVYGYILRNHLYGTNADLKHLTLSQLRPVALSYLNHKRIPHVLGTEQEAIRLAERYGADIEKARANDGRTMTADIGYKVLKAEETIGKGA